jgi:hypothetical protein
MFSRVTRSNEELKRYVALKGDSMQRQSVSAIAID